MKLCLVCSSGGHFLELYFLKEFWGNCERFWITFLKEDNASLLRDEKTYEAFHPTNRSIVNFIRNSFMAFKVLIKEKPDFVVSTGAGVGVPFIYAGKLLRIKTVYVESRTRVKELSLTGRLILPVVDHLIVRWPELSEKYKKCEFAGSIS